jgi:hypothetical protein
MKTKVKKTKVKKPTERKFQDILWDNWTDWNIDDKVYIVCGPDDVRESEITAFGSVTLMDKGKLLSIAQTARTGTWLMNSYFDGIDDIAFNEFIPFKYLFKDKKKAVKLSKFRSVSVSDDKWDKAIGERGNEKLMEVCELQPCCSNVSCVRDMLIRCKEKKGLTGLETSWLQGYVNEGFHGAELFCQPTLKSIFGLLGIKICK